MPDYRLQSEEKDEDDLLRNAHQKIWRRPSQPLPIPMQGDSASAEETEPNMVSQFSCQRTTASESRLADLALENDSIVDSERSIAGGFRTHMDSQAAVTVRSDSEVSAHYGSACARTSMVTCGYQHCAAEAVRYLIEEEHFSPSDPLVVGLQQHLSMQERHLDPERVLGEYMIMQRLLLSSSGQARLWEDDATDGRHCESEDERSDDEEFSDDGSEMEDASDCSLVQSLSDLASAYLLEMCQAAQNGFKTNSRLPTADQLPSSPAGTHYPDFLPLDDRPLVTSPSPSI